MTNGSLHLGPWLVCLVVLLASACDPASAPELRERASQQRAPVAPTPTPRFADGSDARSEACPDGYPIRCAEGSQCPAAVIRRPTITKTAV